MNVPHQGFGVWSPMDKDGSNYDSRLSVDFEDYFEKLTYEMPLHQKMANFYAQMFARFREPGPGTPAGMVEYTKQFQDHDPMTVVQDWVTSHQELCNEYMLWVKEHADKTTTDINSMIGVKIQPGYSRSYEAILDQKLALKIKGLDKHTEMYGRFLEKLFESAAKYVFVLSTKITWRLNNDNEVKWISKRLNKINEEIEEWRVKMVAAKNLDKIDTAKRIQEKVDVLSKERDDLSKKAFRRFGTSGMAMNAVGVALCVLNEMYASLHYANERAFYVIENIQIGEPKEVFEKGSFADEIGRRATPGGRVVYQIEPRDGGLNLQEYIEVASTPTDQLFIGPKTGMGEQEEEMKEPSKKMSNEERAKHLRTLLDNLDLNSEQKKVVAAKIGENELDSGKVNKLIHKTMLDLRKLARNKEYNKQIHGFDQISNNILKFTNPYVYRLFGIWEPDFWQTSVTNTKNKIQFMIGMMSVITETYRFYADRIREFYNDVTGDNDPYYRFLYTEITETRMKDSGTTNLTFEQEVAMDNFVREFTEIYAMYKLLVPAQALDNTAIQESNRYGLTKASQWREAIASIKRPFYFSEYGWLGGIADFGIDLVTLLGQAGIVGYLRSVTFLKQEVSYEITEKPSVFEYLNPFEIRKTWKMRGAADVAMARAKAAKEQAEIRVKECIACDGKYVSRIYDILERVYKKATGPSKYVAKMIIPETLHGWFRGNCGIAGTLIRKVLAIISNVSGYVYISKGVWTVGIAMIGKAVVNLLMTGATAHCFGFGIVGGTFVWSAMFVKFLLLALFETFWDFSMPYLLNFINNHIMRKTKIRSGIITLAFAQVIKSLTLLAPIGMSAMVGGAGKSLHPFFDSVKPMVLKEASLFTFGTNMKNSVMSKFFGFTDKTSYLMYVVSEGLYSLFSNIFKYTYNLSFGSAFLNNTNSKDLIDLAKGLPKDGYSQNVMIAVADLFKVRRDQVKDKNFEFGVPSVYKFFGNGIKRIFGLVLRKERSSEIKRVYGEDIETDPFKRELFGSGGQIVKKLFKKKFGETEEVDVQRQRQWTNQQLMSVLPNVGIWNTGHQYPEEYQQKNEIVEIVGGEEYAQMEGDEVIKDVKLDQDIIVANEFEEKNSEHYDAMNRVTFELEQDVGEQIENLENLTEDEVFKRLEKRVETRDEDFTVDDVFGKPFGQKTFGEFDIPDPNGDPNVVLDDMFTPEFFREEDPTSSDIVSKIGSRTVTLTREEVTTAVLMLKGEQAEYGKEEPPKPYIGEYDWVGYKDPDDGFVLKISPDDRADDIYRKSIIPLWIYITENGDKVPVIKSKITWLLSQAKMLMEKGEYDKAESTFYDAFILHFKVTREDIFGTAFKMYAGREVDPEDFMSDLLGGVDVTKIRDKIGNVDELRKMMGDKIGVRFGPVTDPGTAKQLSKECIERLVEADAGFIKGTKEFVETGTKKSEEHKYKDNPTGEDHKNAYKLDIAMNKVIFSLSSETSVNIRIVDTILGQAIDETVEGKTGPTVSGTAGEYQDIQSFIGPKFDDYDDDDEEEEGEGEEEEDKRVFRYLVGPAYRLVHLAKSGFQKIYEMGPSLEIPDDEREEEIAKVKKEIMTRSEDEEAFAPVKKTDEEYQKELFDSFQDQKKEAAEAYKIAVETTSSIEDVIKRSALKTLHEKMNNMRKLHVLKTEFDIAKKSYLKHYRNFMVGKTTGKEVVVEGIDLAAITSETMIQLRDILRRYVELTEEYKEFLSEEVLLKQAFKKEKYPVISDMSSALSSIIDYEKEIKHLSTLVSDRKARDRNNFFLTISNHFTVKTKKVIWYAERIRRAVWDLFVISEEKRKWIMGPQSKSLTHRKILLTNLIGINDSIEKCRTYQLIGMDLKGSYPSTISSRAIIAETEKKYALECFQSVRNAVDAFMYNFDMWQNNKAKAVGEGTKEPQMPNERMFVSRIRNYNYELNSILSDDRTAEMLEDITNREMGHKYTTIDYWKTKLDVTKSTNRVVQFTIRVMKRVMDYATRVYDVYNAMFPEGTFSAVKGWTWALLGNFYESGKSIAQLVSGSSILVLVRWFLYISEFVINASAEILSKYKTTIIPDHLWFLKCVPSIIKMFGKVVTTSGFWIARNTISMAQKWIVGSRRLTSGISSAIKSGLDRMGIFRDGVPGWLSWTVSMGSVALLNLVIGKYVFGWLKIPGMMVNIASWIVGKMIPNATYSVFIYSSINMVRRLSAPVALALIQKILMVTFRRPQVRFGIAIYIFLDSMATFLMETGVAGWAFSQMMPSYLRGLVFPKKKFAKFGDYRISEYEAYRGANAMQFFLWVHALTTDEQLRIFVEKMFVGVGEGVKMVGPVNVAKGLFKFGKKMFEWIILAIEKIVPGLMELRWLDLLNYGKYVFTDLPKKAAATVSIGTVSIVKMTVEELKNLPTTTKDILITIPGSAVKVVKKAGGYLIRGEFIRDITDLVKLFKNIDFKDFFSGLFNQIGEDMVKEQSFGIFALIFYLSKSLTTLSLLCLGPELKPPTLDELREEMNIATEELELGMTTEENVQNLRIMRFNKRQQWENIEVKKQEFIERLNKIPLNEDEINLFLDPRVDPPSTVGKASAFSLVINEAFQSMDPETFKKDVIEVTVRKISTKDESVYLIEDTNPILLVMRKQKVSEEQNRKMLMRHFRKNWFIDTTGNFVGGIFKAMGNFFSLPTSIYSGINYLIQATSETLGITSTLMGGHHRGYFPIHIKTYMKRKSKFGKIGSKMVPLCDSDLSRTFTVNAFNLLESSREIGIMLVDGNLKKGGTLPLTSIEPQHFAPILEFINYHNYIGAKCDVPNCCLEKDITEYVSDWDANFVQSIRKNGEEFTKSVLIAANVLGVEDLKELMCASIASTLIGKSPRFIAQAFDAEYDSENDDSENDDDDTDVENGNDVGEFVPPSKIAEEHDVFLYNDINSGNKFPDNIWETEEHQNDEDVIMTDQPLQLLPPDDMLRDPEEDPTVIPIVKPKFSHDSIDFGDLFDNEDNEDNDDMMKDKMIGAKGRVVWKPGYTTQRREVTRMADPEIMDVVNVYNYGTTIIGGLKDTVIPKEQTWFEPMVSRITEMLSKFELGRKMLKLIENDAKSISKYYNMLLLRMTWAINDRIFQEIYTDKRPGFTMAFRDYMRLVYHILPHFYKKKTGILYIDPSDGLKKRNNAGVVVLTAHYLSIMGDSGLIKTGITNIESVMIGGKCNEDVIKILSCLYDYTDIVKKPPAWFYIVGSEIMKRLAMTEHGRRILDNFRFEYIKDPGSDSSKISDIPKIDFMDVYANILSQISEEENVKLMKHMIEKVSRFSRSESETEKAKLLWRTHQIYAEGVDDTDTSIIIMYYHYLIILGSQGLISDRISDSHSQIESMIDQTIDVIGARLTKSYRDIPWGMYTRYIKKYVDISFADYHSLYTALALFGQPIVSEIKEYITELFSNYIKDTGAREATTSFPVLLEDIANIFKRFESVYKDSDLYTNYDILNKDSVDLVMIALTYIGEYAARKDIRMKLLKDDDSVIKPSNDVISHLIGPRVGRRQSRLRRRPMWGPRSSRWGTRWGRFFGTLGSVFYRPPPYWMTYPGWFRSKYPWQRFPYYYWYPYTHYSSYPAYQYGYQSQPPIPPVPDWAYPGSYTTIPPYWYTYPLWFRRRWPWRRYPRFYRRHWRYNRGRPGWTRGSRRGPFKTLPYRRRRRVIPYRGPRMRSVRFRRRPTPRTRVPPRTRVLPRSRAGRRQSRRVVRRPARRVPRGGRPRRVRDNLM